MKKKFFIGLFIFAAIGLFLFAHIALRHNAEVEQIQQSALQAPIEIPATGITSLEEAIKSDKPVLAMFYVDWCTYCRRFMPMFGLFSIAYKNKYAFAAINCEEPAMKELVKEYDIYGYPTVYIIDKKLDFYYAINPMLFSEQEALKKEFDKYLKLRSKLPK